MLLNILSAYVHMCTLKDTEALLNSPLYVLQNIIGIIGFTQFSANNLQCRVCSALIVA